MAEGRVRSWSGTDLGGVEVGVPVELLHRPDGRRAWGAPVAAFEAWLDSDLAGASRLAVESLADPATTPAGRGLALGVLAGVAQAEGRAAHALSLASRGASLARTGRTPTPAGDVNVAAALLELDRYDEALALLDAGLEHPAVAGTAMRRWFTAYRALARFLAGRWDAALDDVEDSRSAAPSGRPGAVLPLVDGLAEVVRQLRSPVPLPARTPPFALGGTPVFGDEWMLGARALAAQDPIGRFAAWREAWERTAPRRFMLTWRFLAPETVHASLALGMVAVATAVVAELERCAATLAGPSAQGSLLLCRGLLNADPEPVVAAAVLVREVSSPVVTGGASLAAAEALLLAGRAGEALPWLERAVASYDRLGERRRGDVARGLLAHQRRVADAG